MNGTRTHDLGPRARLADRAASRSHRRRGHAVLVAGFSAHRVFRRRQADARLCCWRAHPSGSATQATRKAEPGFRRKVEDGVIVFAPDNRGPASAGAGAGWRAHSLRRRSPKERPRTRSRSSSRMDVDFFFSGRGKQAGIYVQSLDSAERTFVMNVDRSGCLRPRRAFCCISVTPRCWPIDGTSRRWGSKASRRQSPRRALGRRQWPQRVCHLRERRPRLSRWRIRRQDADQLVHARWQEGKLSSWKPGHYGHIALSPDDRYLSVVVGTGDDRNLWLKISRAVSFRP